MLPQFKLFGTGEDGLCGPPGKLVGVILELSGEHSTSLGVQLLSPIHTCSLDALQTSMRSPHYIYTGGNLQALIPGGGGVPWGHIH